MKKFYALFLSFLAWTLQGEAQITLQSSDLPVAGLAFTMGTDDTYSAPIPAGGPGQTWNYSTLVNVNEDTVGFIPAAGTPFASQVPSANLATYNPSTGNYGYFTSSSSGFYNVGASDTGITGGFAELDPPLLFVPTPFTYLDTLSSNARLEVFTTFYDSTLGTLNLKIVHRVHSSFLCDGWGTLILPNTTHNNTLRIAVTERIKDSVFVDLTGLGFYTFFLDDSSQQVTYRWFTNGPAAYVLGITADSLGTTAVSSEYLLNYILLGTQDQTSMQHSIQAYPNPAAQHIRLRWEAGLPHASLQFLDATGRLVYSAHLDNMNTVDIPVDRYPNGLYHYRLQWDNGHMETGKFAVSH